MPAFRPQGNAGSFTSSFIGAGDLSLGGEVISLNATIGAATLAANQLVTGILSRSGSTGAYTDTLDNAQNIITALSAGANNLAPIVEVGSTFRLRIINTVAFAETIAATAGAGVILNSGTFVTPASSWRDLLFTIKAAQPVREVVQAVTTINSANVTFVLATGQQSLPIGPSPTATNIENNATVSGTGIPNGTTVIGLTQGQGGLIGCTLSGTATASGTTSLTFGPTIYVDSLGSGTL